MGMKSIIITRDLNEETRKQSIVIGKEVYSMHIDNDEVIITDFSDYKKVYCVYSVDFYNLMASFNQYR